MAASGGAQVSIGYAIDDLERFAALLRQHGAPAGEAAGPAIPAGVAEHLFLFDVALALLDQSRLGWGPLSAQLRRLRLAQRVMEQLGHYKPELAALALPVQFTMADLRLAPCWQDRHEEGASTLGVLRWFESESQTRFLVLEQEDVDKARQEDSYYRSAEACLERLSEAYGKALAGNAALRALAEARRKADYLDRVARHLGFASNRALSDHLVPTLDVIVRGDDALAKRALAEIAGAKGDVSLAWLKSRGYGLLACQDAVNAVMLAKLATWETSEAFRLTPAGREVLGGALPAGGR